MPSGNNSKARNGVFISYARRDGEAFADVLLTRLEALGVEAWQDRARMEDGRDWWLQITEALDRVEFMALVVTPGALRSEIVRREWRYARQQGVCVYTIKGTPDLDFNTLPRWIRSADFYDIGTVANDFTGPEWQNFVNDINTGISIRTFPPRPS